MIRLDVDRDIKPHLAMALIDAGVAVPDSRNKDEPYDPKADEAAMLAAAIESHLTAELDELPDEIEGKTVIGITYDEGVMSFIVGDTIDDVAACFEDVTEAVLHATTLVADHEADGHDVILVVSDLVQSFQGQAKGQAHYGSVFHADVAAFRPIRRRGRGLVFGTFVWSIACQLMGRTSPSPH